MATRTAPAGASNWTAAAFGGGAATVAADEVIIPSGATVTVSAANTVLCRSLSVTGTGTLIFAATTSIIAIGDATPGTGNSIINISSTATITLTGIGTINLATSSATQQTITSGGKTLPNITFNGAGGSWLLSDALTSSGTITLSAGTFDTGSQTINAVGFNYGNTTTRTLTMGSSAITLTGVNSFTATAGTNLTISSNTAVITFTNASTGLGFSGINWNGMSIVFNGGGAAQMNAATLANITVTGGANQTSNLTLNGNLTVTGTFTVTGNSAVNRVIIQSSTVGTARTITAAAVSLTNVDFQDITGAGAASPFTGTTLGDRQGNSGITFTTPATQTRDATSGQAWGVAARWTSRVPLPQDDVILNGSSGSISATDVAVLGKNIDASAYTGTITSTSTNTPYIAFGSVSFGGTFVQANTWYLEYRGRGSHTITSNGNVGWCGSSNGRHYIYAIGGTYTLADAYNLMQGSNGGLLYIVAGTFNSASYSMTIGLLNSTTITFIRSILLGTSILTHYQFPTNTAIDLAATNLTYTGSNATHNITGGVVANSAKTIGGGGIATLGTINFNEAGGMGVLKVTGANTFAGMNIGENRKLQMTAATTTTFTNAPTFAGQNNGYVRQIPGIPYVASVPDSAALSIAGDIDVRMRLSLNDVARSGSQRIFAKYLTTGNQRSYRIFISSGTPNFTYSTDGTTDVAAQAATATLASVGIANDVVFWFRVTREQSTGIVKFYYAADDINMPSSWTQLGSNVAGTAAASFFDSTALVTFGGEQGGTNSNPGNYYWCQVRNNILDDGTGIQLDMKLQDKALGVDTFTEGSSNAATVTLYDPGSAGSIGDGRVQLESITAATHTLSSANPVDGTGMKITNSIASGNVPFYAGVGSLNISGNTNWTFTARPAATSNGNFLMFM